MKRYDFMKSWWRGTCVLSTAVRIASVPFEDSLRWSLSEIVSDIVGNHSDGRFFFEMLIVTGTAVPGKPRQKSVYLIIHHLFARHSNSLGIQHSKLLKTLRDRGFDALSISSAELETVYGTCKRSDRKGVAGQSAKVRSSYHDSGDNIIGNLIRTQPSGTAFSLLLTKNNASEPVKVTGMSFSPTDASLTAFKSALSSWNVATFRHSFRNYVEMRLQAHGVNSGVIGTRTITPQGLERLLEMPSGSYAGLPMSDPFNRPEDISQEMFDSEKGVHVADVRVGEENNALYFHTENLERGTAILGASGFGKTALIQNMMLGCHRAGMNVLCLDLEGTELRRAAHKLGADIYTMGGKESPYPVNCFRIKGFGREETKNVLKEVFLSTLDCPSPLDAYLADALEMMYGGNGIVAAPETYKAYIARAFAERYHYSEENTQNLRTASEVRLRLTDCLMGGPNDTFDVSALAEGCTFIEFRQMTSEHEKLFALTFILFTLMTYAKKRHACRHAIRPLVVFIDELHILLDSQVDQKVKNYLVYLLKRIVHEGRKYNMWLCVADQSPKLLMPVIESVQSKLVMRADSCAEELAEQLNRKEAPVFLPKLKTGEAFVRTGNMPCGAFVRTPTPVKLQDISDAEVREYMRKRGRLLNLHRCRQESQSEENKVEASVFRPDDRIGTLVERLTDELVDFAFTFIMEHPEKIGQFSKSFNLHVFMKAKGHDELTAQVSERLRQRYNTATVMHFLCKYS